MSAQLKQYIRKSSELKYKTIEKISKKITLVKPLSPENISLLKKIFRNMYRIYEDDVMTHDDKDGYFIAILSIVPFTKTELQDIEYHLTTLFNNEHKVKNYGTPLGCDGRIKYFFKVE